MNNSPDSTIENGAGMLQDALRSLREGRYPEALAGITKALEAGVPLEALAEIYPHLTALFEEPGQEVQRTRFLEALLDVPLTARSIVHYALVNQREGYADQLTRALQAQAPNDPEVFIIRSMFLQAVNRLEEALAAANQAVNLNVENLDAYFWRADLSRFQAVQTAEPDPLQAFNQALDDYGQILKLDPGNLEGLGQRGMLNLEWGDALAEQDQTDVAASHYRKALQDFDAVIAKVPELPLAYLQRGRTWHRLGEAEKALADYDRALELEPRWAEALNERGLLHEALENFDRALADYENLVREAPESPVAYRLRADAQLALDNPAAALVDYRRSIELDPAFVDAYLGLAKVQTLQENYEQALQTYEQVLQLDSENLEALGQRGTLYLLWGDTLADQDQADDAGQKYEKARLEFDALLAKVPDVPRAHLQRGRAWAKLNQAAKALADYDKALELEPNWLEALNARGLLHEALGNYTQALADYEGLVRGAPESPFAYRLRADAQLALGDYAAALADYSRAIELEPAFIEAYLGVAQVQALQEKYEQALQAYEHILLLDPGNLEGLGRRGTLYLEWGDSLAGEEQVDAAAGYYRKALQDFDAVLEIVSDLPLAYLQRGRTWTRLEEAEKALADYEKVLAFDPHWVEALNERGLLHEALGNFDQALADYEGLVREAPESPVAYRLRADAQLALENDAAALADYQRAVELDPAFIEAYLGIAQVQVRREEYALALEAYEKILQLDPGNLEGFGRRGTLYMEWGDTLIGQGRPEAAAERYRQALQNFDAVIAEVPELPLAYLQRGRTWDRLGEPVNALADYDKVLAIEPNWVEALNERGLLRESLGKYDQALADYEGLVREAPESPVAYRLRADARAALGHFELALADYTHAIELDRKFIQAYLGRADVHEKMGNDKLALQDYEYSILLAPDDPQGYFLRGLLYLSMGDGYQAIWDIDRALALDGSLPQGYTGRASAYLKVGDEYLARRHYGKARESFLKALQDSQEAVRQDPADYFAHRSCGFALWNLEDYAAAAQSFDQAIQKLDGAASDLTPELYAYKGETLGTVGLVQEQREVQEKALEAFDSALAGSTDPGEKSWINYSKGNYLLSLKRAVDALPCFIQARKINPAYPWAYYGQGRANYLLGKLADAAEALEALLHLPALQESGLAPYAQIGLGLLAEKAGDKKTAQARYAEALAGDPSPAGYLDRARIFNEFDAAEQEEGDYQKALALAQEAFTGAGESEQEKKDLAGQLAEAYNALAWFYVKKGKVAAEKETFFRYARQAVAYAVEAFHKGNNLDTLGWGYYQVGEFEKAYEHLQQAAELTPHDFMIRYHVEKAREEINH